MLFIDFRDLLVISDFWDIIVALSQSLSIDRFFLDFLRESPELRRWDRSLFVPTRDDLLVWWSLVGFTFFLLFFVECRLLLVECRLLLVEDFKSYISLLSRSMRCLPSSSSFPWICLCEQSLSDFFLSFDYLYFEQEGHKSVVLVRACFVFLLVFLVLEPDFGEKMVLSSSMQDLNSSSIWWLSFCIKLFLIFFILSCSLSAYFSRSLFFFSRSC